MDNLTERKYLHILEQLVQKRAEMKFTQGDMAKYLNCSLRKINYFEGGRIDLELLIDYSNILGKPVIFCFE